MQARDRRQRRFGRFASAICRPAESSIHPPLLSDPDGSVRDRYRVPRTFGIIPGRTTFLIDQNGTIQRISRPEFQPAKHVTEAPRPCESSAHE